MRSYEKSFIITVDSFPAEGTDPAGYVATNDELGLVVEAASLDELARKILEVGPDLFKLNVLPNLEERAAKVPPAFVIHHALGNSNRGGLLS